MNKLKAAFYHFLISLLFISLFISFVFFVWYQQIYFNISGVAAPLKLLVVVDVILGPLLTLVIYRQGKKHLKLDLFLIAVSQFIAFGYGAYHIYLGKPSLIIHRTGYFEVIIEKNVDYSKLNDGMRERNFAFYPVYGKVDSDELDPISSIHSYLGEVVLFEVKNKAGFTQPLTLEKAENTFKNAVASTKERFQSLIQKNNELVFYELKFDGLFGVLFINKQDFVFEAALIP